jgi:NAD(P)-dependent dehydrogenase (short-subunit alcohol dehydrogenase family)
MKIDDPNSIPALQWPLLQGRRVIITGGAGGIGRPTAKLLAGMGARVAILDMAPATIEVAEQIGGDHMGVVVDVAISAAVNDAVAQVEKYPSVSGRLALNSIFGASV